MGVVFFFSFFFPFFLLFGFLWLFFLFKQTARIAKRVGARDGAREGSAAEADLSESTGVRAPSIKFPPHRLCIYLLPVPG
jgi:hypothetical protein